MDKVVSFLVDKKTEIVTNLGVIVVVIAAIVTGTYQITTMKTQFELKSQATEERLAKEIIDRKAADDTIFQKLKETDVSLAEIQSSQADIKTGLARVETNIIWIMDYMKENK